MATSKLMHAQLFQQFPNIIFGEMFPKLRLNIIAVEGAHLFFCNFKQSPKSLSSWGIPFNELCVNRFHISKNEQLSYGSSFSDVHLLPC